MRQRNRSGIVFLLPLLALLGGAVLAVPKQGGAAVRLHRLTQQADLFLNAPKELVTSKTHAEAYLLKDAIRNALIAYQSTRAPAQALLERGTTSLIGLESFMERLMKPPAAIAALHDPVVDAARTLAQADTLLTEAALGQEISSLQIESALQKLERQKMAQIRQTADSRWLELIRAAASRRIVQLRDQLNELTQELYTPLKGSSPETVADLQRRLEAFGRQQPQTGVGRRLA